MASLRPYEDIVRQAEAKFRRMFASDTASVAQIATTRRTWELLAAQLRENPDYVLAYNRRRSSAFGNTAPQLWYNEVYQKVSDEIQPEFASAQTAAAFGRKREEYLEMGQRIANFPRDRYRYVANEKTGRSYLYKENEYIPRVAEIIAVELVHWFERHLITPAFLAQSAKDGVLTFLSERPDLVALLRIAQKLPIDAEIGEIPIERSVMEELTETVLGAFPVLGNLLAAYEAYAGKDLFGYHLTDVERGVMTASVLLPIAGRLTKGGRALYSEARLVALYGREAADWSRTIRAARRAAAGAYFLESLEEAEALILARRGLGRELAQDAAGALSKLVKNPVPASSVVDEAVAALFKELAAKFKIMEGLDEMAIERILAKGTDISHIKGQLLEELLETRVVPWLRERAGSFALGIDTGGKKLEFIPGHLIRDIWGGKITDGILVVRDGKVFDIVAVFEAKSGKGAAKGLRRMSTSYNKLSAEEKIERRKRAADMFKEMREEARRAGKPFKTTLEEVERGLVMSEYGGQFRSVIERLQEGEKVFIATLGPDPTPIRISPTRTKFFGVVPQDINVVSIEKSLEGRVKTVEILPVNIRSRDLTSVAERIKALNEKLAASPR